MLSFSTIKAGDYSKYSKAAAESRNKWPGGGTWGDVYVVFSYSLVDGKGSSEGRSVPNGIVSLIGVFADKESAEAAIRQNAEDNAHTLGIREDV